MPQENDLWSIAAGRWKLLASFTMGGLLIGVMLSLVLPRQYRVQTTVLTVAPENAVGGTQTGVARSLASIVGVGLGPDNVREEALALLRSDRLAWEFLTSNQAVGLLTAGENLNEDDVRGTVIDRFQRNILSVQDDRRTGLITVSILWRDRDQAADWANAYVRLADEELRTQTLKDSERTLDLLRNELELTTVNELRNSINRFYETQLQRMLFARARSAFALRTIDPALAPAASDTAAPNKKLIIASALVLGAIAGLILAVVLETSSAVRLRSPARRAPGAA
jgi:uncharacterized protein involved in exopolysaccharide biosynthesis